jgi:selenocysteine-specific elongation factor
VKESKDLLTDDVFQSLVERGALVQLSTEVVVRKAEYDLMLGYVIERCSRGELLTLAQFRDHFNTNRKVSQAFLEFLDRKGVTQRVGEGRVLK